VGGAWIPDQVRNDELRQRLDSGSGLYMFRRSKVNNPRLLRWGLFSPNVIFSERSFLRSAAIAMLDIQLIFFHYE
jgi:hypothetical protein